MHKTMYLSCAIVALAALSAAAKDHFVLCDPFLRLPAICYTLERGWQGQGGIQWDMRAGNNNIVVANVVLSNPSTSELVQEFSPVWQEVSGMNGLSQVYQNPNLMVRYIANQFNNSPRVAGLGTFTPVSGRFTADIPDKTMRNIQKTFAREKYSGRRSAFKVVCEMKCTYFGRICDARYEYVATLHQLQVRPNLPVVGYSLNYNTRLIIAPEGTLGKTIRTAGKMLGGAFTNNIWSYAVGRTISIIKAGREIGRREGMELLKESERENQRIMEDIRKQRSQMIREVVEVDNPLSPGSKIERPAFFDHSWINSSQDKMILSNTAFETHEINKLIGSGVWLPAE